MARIPQYNRSVTPQNTPYEYIKSNASPEAFGVNQAAAMGRLGDAGTNAIDALVTLKANYDKTKLFEFGNALDKWINDTLYDKDNGYIYKTGKEAMGKSPDMLDSYDKFADECLSKSGFIAGWNNQARRIIESKRINFENKVEAHDRKQSDAWQDMVYTESLSNVLSKAVQGRNNPQDLEVCLKDGNTILSNYALIKGWDKDPETFAIKKKEFEAGLYGQVLDAYIAEGSLKANEFFEQHKDKFPPEMQNKYLQKIHNEEMNYKARTTVDNLMNVTPEQAYEYINQIENNDERDSVEREYNRRRSQKNSIDSQNKKDGLNEFYTKALAAEQNGNTLSYDDIPDNLDPETKLSLMNYINKNGNPDTDAQIWDDLYNMSINNAQGFAALDLNQYRGFLSDGEYKSFVQKQEEIKQGKYYSYISTDDAIVKEGLKAIGLSGGKKNDVAYSEIRAMVRELEARKGRSVTDEELTDITNSLGYKDKQGVAIYKKLEEGMAKKTGFIRNVMNDFVYYQSQHNGQMPPDEEKYNIIMKRVSQEQQKQKSEAESFVDNHTYSASTFKNIASIESKPNEQKVLTYFADKQIPALSKQLGFNLTVTSRYRKPNGKYPSHHSEGRAADVSMSELNRDQKKMTIEKLLKLPTVQKIGTSDPMILANYPSSKYPKIKDETRFDKEHGTNHKNHVHVTLINYNPEAPKQKVAVNGKYSF